jgi:phospholipase/carboxylesterase
MALEETSQVLQHRIRPAAGEPEGALVLLHGRGVDETDLYPLLDELDPRRRLLGVTPRAPLQFAEAPGNHWYVVHRVGFPDPDTFFPTFGVLEEYMSALAEESGVPIERTVIGGFSQGGVMSHALTVGKGRPRPAGLLALSCFMPRVEGFELVPEQASGLPVAMAHGTYDPIIPVEFGREARDWYQAAGADLTWRESPMAHSIDPRFLLELRDWVGRALPSSA